MGESEAEKIKRQLAERYGTYVKKGSLLDKVIDRLAREPKKEEKK